MEITLIAPISNNGDLLDDHLVARYMPEAERRIAKAVRGNTLIMSGPLYYSIINRDSVLEDAIVMERTRGIVISPLKREGRFLSAEAFNSLENALDCLERDGSDNVYIFGDREIINEALTRATHLDLTTARIYVKGKYQFPKIGPEWNLSQQEEKPDYFFKKYIRDHSNQTAE
jgi:dihydrofolate reductase